MIFNAHKSKLFSPSLACCPGAQAVHDKPLIRIEVHGKNLFYFFGDAASPQIVHIHFGMSGAFKTMTLPGPDPTETTRLKLVNEKHGVVAQLSAMTVILGDLGKLTTLTTCLCVLMHKLVPIWTSSCTDSSFAICPACLH